MKDLFIKMRSVAKLDDKIILSFLVRAKEEGQIITRLTPVAYAMKTNIENILSSAPNAKEMLAQYKKDVDVIIKSMTEEQLRNYLNEIHQEYTEIPTEVSMENTAEIIKKLSYYTIQ